MLTLAVASRTSAADDPKQLVGPQGCGDLRLVRVLGGDGVGATVAC